MMAAVWLPSAIRLATAARAALSPYDRQHAPALRIPVAEPDARRSAAHTLPRESTRSAFVGFAMGAGRRPPTRKGRPGSVGRLRFAGAHRTLVGRSSYKRGSLCGEAFG